MGEKKTVLVVEDDEKTRLLVIRALGTRYAVQEASDGLAASDFLSRGRTPDLVVCDVMMPRMDGIALLKKMKGDPKLKGIPILILSARNTPKDVIEGIGAGARQYMTKPFSVKDLLERVSRLLGETE
jgi:DNA-binding response OmpR family regulator